MTHSINVLVKKLGTQDLNEVMVLEQGNGLFGQIKDQMTMLQTMGMSTDLRNVDFINAKNFEQNLFKVFL